MVSDRSVGWLRYLHRTTPAVSGRGRERLGAGRSAPIEAAYAPALTAHRAPAWTEGPSAILDRLVDGLVDGATPGASADRAGGLLVTLGLRSMVADSSLDSTGDGAGTGDGTAIREESGSGRATFTRLAEELCQRWEADRQGLRSSDGTIRPADLAAVGLGLRLHDARHGTSLWARAAEPWWVWARQHWFGLDHPGGPPAEVPVAVDPATGTQGLGPLRDALMVAHLLAAQAGTPGGTGHSQTGNSETGQGGPDPDAPGLGGDARRLFEAAWTTLAPDLHAAAAGAALPTDPAYALAWLLTREWGLTDRAELASAAITAAWEPSWDSGTGEAGWGVTAADGTPIPDRLAALLAAAEATNRGDWWRLVNQPLAPCHQVVGVETPRVLLHRAEWVHDCLRVGLSPAHEDPKRWTTFRIVGAEPRMWYLTGIDGTSMDTAGAATVVRVPLVKGELEFAPGSY